MGYTPLFDSLTKGSLCGKWPDIGLWPVVLSMADWRGEIHCTHQHIAAVSGLNLDEVIACMERYCAPDPHSGSTNDEGRRLVLLQSDRAWGWKVVNIQKYRDKASGKDQADDGRNAAKCAKYRGKKSHEGDTARHRATPRDTARHLQTPTHTSDSDSNSEKNPSASATPTRTVRRKVSHETDPDWMLDFKLAYPDRAGDQGWRKAVRAANARIAEGHTPDEFLAGAERYAAYCEATEKTGTEFVKQACTFLGPDKHFKQLWAAPKPNGNGQHLTKFDRQMARSEANRLYDDNGNPVDEDGNKITF